MSQDAVFTPDGQSPSDSVGWKDSHGTLYGAGQWNSTGGAASVTLTAMVWSDSGYAEYTYPPLTFGTEPDSSCVQAADTVTTRVVACNTSTNGTSVEFVYTNTDDASDLAHTRPDLQVVRWDNGQHAYLVWSEGQVADGVQSSVTGGDFAGGDVYNKFFLAPGTYSLTLRTKETGTQVLPNRLFVPACGTYKPPPGDPHGGPIPTDKPKATISRCHNHQVRVALDTRNTNQATRYRLVVDPRRGRTKVDVLHLDARSLKVVRLRHQKSDTVVKVAFSGNRVTRTLTCR